MGVLRGALAVGARRHVLPRPPAAAGRSGPSSCSTSRSCSTPTGSTAPPSCSTTSPPSTGPDRPCLRTDDEIWTYGELLARANQVAHVLAEDLGVGARPPRPAARAEQPVAGGLLARRPQGRRRRRHDGAAAARPRARPRRASSPAQRGAVRRTASPTTSPPAAAAPDLPSCPTAAGDADDLVARAARPSRRRSTPSTPPPTTSRCSARPPAPPASRRSPCTSTATCSPIADTFGRHVLQPEPDDVVHRHPAVRVHLRPRRAAWSSRCGPARRALLIEKATPAAAGRADRASTASTVLFTAPTAYRADAAGRRERTSCAGLRARCRAGEHLPRGDLGGVPRRDRRRG